MSLEPKKLALIRTIQILEEYTDSEHPMTQEEIVEKLDTLYDIEVERKAVGRNLSLLKEAGYDIISVKRGSYLNYRDFDNSELRMLIDGVLSSRYISAGYSKDLIDRLCKLSNKYFKSHVNHIHSVDDWNKTDNKALFLNIEMIDEAIEKGKQIYYVYNKYGINKKMQKSSQHRVSPYQMILHNQRYYLMAYSEYYKGICFHRLDHITNIAIVDKPATPLKSVPGYEKGINYKELSTSMPYMYADKPIKIELVTTDALIDQIVDWFGTDISIVSLSDNQIKVTIKASAIAMKYWAMQYVNSVEVVYPESLREEIKKDLENAIKKYK